jgi:hypothetical protein
MLVSAFGPRGCEATLELLVGDVKTAILKEERFVTDTDCKRIGVLLDLKAYQELRAAQEDLADIEAYDAARKKTAEEIASGEFVTLAEYRANQRRKRK